MSLSLALYGAVEAVLGRSMTSRLGRWMYLGSRRELRNDPTVNGEYALLCAWANARSSLRGPEGGYRLIDVGANVGDWTLSFENQLEHAGIAEYIILAFEPAPSQRSEMVARCSRAIAAGRVDIDPRALGAEAHTATLTITGERSGTSSLTSAGPQELEGSQIEVGVSTLDAVCAERGFGRIQFIKVDTEGNDFNVILGARRLFEAEAIEILQFEYNWRWIDFGHWLKDVFRFLTNRPYVLGRLTSRGIEIYSEWHFELDRYIEANYVIAHLNVLDSIPHWYARFDASNSAQRCSEPRAEHGAP